MSATAEAMTAPTAMTCRAKTRKGGQCGRPAGWGTDHVGAGACKLHGGATPTGQVHGVVHLARRESVAMGYPLNIEPHEALLECIRISAGEVQYASERIAELDPSEIVGPVITTRPRKQEKGAESAVERVEEHEGPALHIWIKVRGHAMDRLVNYSKVAIAAGIEERRVKVAEQQGELLAQAIRGVLAELGVGDRPEVPGIVRKHLTAISGTAREVE